MFATLAGALPWPPVPPDDAEARLEVVVRAQQEAGLEPITDGRGPIGSDVGDETIRSAEAVVARWQAAARLTDRAVKQALVGPFTLARTRAAGALAPATHAPATLAPVVAGARGRAEQALDLADRLNGVLRALAAAGCPIVEIHEPALIDLHDDAERTLYVEAQRRLLAGIREMHASLAVVGGSAAAATAPVVFDAPYRSHLFDLIRGPDDWRLVAAAPAERGIVCGALGVAPDADDAPDLLVWAARYAASTRGRGLARVGLATAGSLAALPWEVAARRMERLVHGARLATLGPREAVAAGLDPRAVDIRTAALGRYAPRRRRPQPPGGTAGA